ncbi:OLC1v1030968C2 [Oldenlandia corymbosa var. corymbosa]|nr:OLC1v1030968C2 [Oldenlandia corymbosa var. corymbosa]
METSDILLLLLSLIISLLFLHVTKLRRRNSQIPNQILDAEGQIKGNNNLPPGNTGWPFFGESLDFFSNFQHQTPQNFVLERCRKYSSKIFKTSILGEKVVVFSGAEGNRFVFSNQKTLLKHWYAASVAKLFGKNSKVMNDNEQTQMGRKFLSSILKGDALKSYVVIFDATIKELLSQFDENSENGQMMMMNDHQIREKLAEKYTITSACKIFLGMESNVEKINAHEQSIKVMLNGLFSLPVNLPGFALNRAINESKALLKEIETMIRERKNMIDDAKCSNNVVNDLLSEMIQPTDGGYSKVVHDVGTALLGLLAASYLGIRITAINVLKHLAEFPEIYDLVLKEQEEIASSKSTETITWEDVRKMKYSWNVVCETLRLAPTSIGGFKEVMMNFDYEGYMIPKGWKIHWNTNATHWNPEYFPNPEKFDPSRFEGDGPIPYTYVPFGGGLHTCPANEFTKFAILIFLHNVVISSGGKRKFSMA